MYSKLSRDTDRAVERARERDLREHLEGPAPSLEDVADEISAVADQVNLIIDSVWEYGASVVQPMSDAIVQLEAARRAVLQLEGEA